MFEVLEALLRAGRAGQPISLCTVVETRGSTPQKAGASMVVAADGSQIGTLGGGCVEAEVKKQVLAAGTAPEPRLHTFTLDHDYGWDDGLICGGRMSILVDPVAAGDQAGLEYYRKLADLLRSGRGGCEILATVSREAIPLGAKWLCSSQGALLAARRAGLQPSLPISPPDPRTRPRPSVQHGFALLPIWPKTRLLVVGGGHVGQAVADLAAQVDFSVWVLDDRQAFANAERFPRAERLLVEAVPQALRRLREEGFFTPESFAVIVTRGHQNDEEALRELAGAPCGYLGLIGSRRKIRLIFEDLLAQGITQEALAQVHAPLGLAIGSQTVPEIAVSIVAELIACRNLGAVPATLRQRDAEVN